jgi:hypothetical protein
MKIKELILIAIALLSCILCFAYLGSMFYKAIECNSQYINMTILCYWCMGVCVGYSIIFYKQKKV